MRLLTGLFSSRREPTSKANSQKYLELYKVFREQDSTLVNHTRQVLQLFVTLVSAVFAATLAAIRTFDFGQAPSFGLLVPAGLCLLNMFLCRLAQAQYRMTARRYYQNITILGKLEKKLDLTTSILPRKWLATRDELTEGQEDSFVNDLLERDHPKLVRLMFTVFFAVNIAIGAALACITDWSLSSFGAMNWMFWLVLVAAGWFLISLLMWKAAEFDGQ